MYPFLAATLPSRNKDTEEAEMQADTYIRQIENLGRIHDLNRRIGKLEVPIGHLLENIKDNQGLIAQHFAGVDDTIPVKFAEEPTKPLNEVMSSTLQLLCELERNTSDAASTANHWSQTLSRCCLLPHAGEAWTESRIEALHWAVLDLEFSITDLMLYFEKTECILGEISSYLRALIGLRASLTQRFSS